MFLSGFSEHPYICGTYIYIEAEKEKLQEEKGEEKQMPAAAEGTTCQQTGKPWPRGNLEMNRNRLI